MNLSPAEQLVLAYAVNRNAIAEVSKKIAALTDWQRPDKGVSLDNIRTDYLEDGDQWRGWIHAVEHVMGNRDEDDETITDDQLELAVLLDQKAELRVEAGAIKRRITAVGRGIIKANAGIEAKEKAQQAKPIAVRHLRDDQGGRESHQMQPDTTGKTCADAARR